jgi:regulator of RNase E activity RraA
MPGAYVFADSSGAVVIPAAQVEEVIAGARNVEAEDETYRAGIKREGIIP